jgi:hypothetical protein
MDTLIGLTDTQIALIVAEKVTGTVSRGAKREDEVINSAHLFLKWLKDNK